MTSEFRIQGLDCAEEVALLKRELGHLHGINQLSFDVMKAKMAVDFDSRHVNAQRITEAVARTGMRAEPFRESTPGEQPWWRVHGRAITTGLSGLFILAGVFAQASTWGEVMRSLMLHDHEGHPLTLAAKMLYLAAMATGAYYSLPKALHAFRRLTPEMNALVVVSIVGAIALNEWLEGATLAFLFSLAGMLESWSIARARRAVSSLLEVTPAEATVLHSHGEHRTRVEHIKVGETVRIKPGERIPCDGQVTTGNSHVDQALITGESIPVLKMTGESVFAGTINGDGLLEVKVGRQPTDTLLSRMLRMLEGAQHRRAPSEQFVERFSRIYTPLTFLLAALVVIATPLLLGWDFGHAAYQGMVILLISCPCALVISTPVTVVAALASAARAGVLVKGGAYLEEAAKLRAFAFDKTGVLTQGKPEVNTFRTFEDTSDRDTLRKLMALEQRSEHPVGQAVVRYAKQLGVGSETISDFHALQGRGAEAIIDNERFWAGSHRFVHEMGVEHEKICSLVDKYEDEGHTAFLCGNQKEVWAVVSLSDPIRPEAKEAIDRLRETGIEHFSMLTGDNEPTAKAVGAKLGVTDVRAALLPDEKAKAIQELRDRYEHVAMVGDGINDTHALASSTIGIALGRRSTDVALETADVVLMNEDLRNLAFLVRHAKRASAVIRQNVVFAIGLKAAFLVLAFCGMATLWMAIAADMGATLLVTFNGLRLLRATK